MSFFNELKRRNVVRVALAYVLISWVLLQGADFFLDVIDAPNWIIQVLLMLAAIGLPAVLLFSWVFEMTPEGLKREHEVNRDHSITPNTGRKLDRVIIVFLVLVIGWFAFDKFFAPQTNQRPEASPVAAATPSAVEAAADTGPSVAVLPFENMSSDAENEYFSDGLTETLLHMLAQLPDLRVAARTSSFAFKGKDASIPEIAAALGVAHILEGSVQKSGDRVRITAQLIRAEDGFHVWSQNYTRPLEDIFAIQDEIANDVALALDESLLGGASKLQGVETADIGAYETYLKAMEQQALFTYASLPVAENLFKQALAEDPTFIDAKLGLARNYMLSLYTGLLDQEAAEEQSAPLFQQVLDADPDNLTARALNLAIRSWFDTTMSNEQRRANIRELRELLPLLPTETIIRGTVSLQLHYLMAQSEDALAVVEAGLILDPLSPELNAQKGEILGELDRFEPAMASLMRADELRPGDPNTLSDIGDIRARMDDLPGKLDWSRKASEADPNDHELAAGIASDLYSLDLQEEGHRWAARVAAQAAQSDVGRRVALERAYASGDYDLAIRLAESMISDRVSIRHGSYPAAIYIFFDLMSRKGRQLEGFDYLNTAWPELAGFEQPPQNFNEILTQLVMAMLEKDLVSPEVSAAHWIIVSDWRDEYGPRLMEFPGVQLNDAVMRNDLEQSRRVLFESYLTAPIALNPARLKTLELPMYAALTGDPEVQAAIARRERDTEAVRAEVREMLLQPEWNQ